MKFNISKEWCVKHAALEAEALKEKWINDACIECARLGMLGNCREYAESLFQTYAEENSPEDAVAEDFSNA